MHSTRSGLDCGRCFLYLWTVKVAALISGMILPLFLWAGVTGAVSGVWHERAGAGMCLAKKLASGRVESVSGQSKRASIAHPRWDPAVGQPCKADGTVRTVRTGSRMPCFELHSSGWGFSGRQAYSVHCGEWVSYFRAFSRDMLVVSGRVSAVAATCDMPPECGRVSAAAAFSRDMLGVSGWVSAAAVTCDMPPECGRVSDAAVFSRDMLVECGGVCSAPVRVPVTVQRHSSQPKLSTPAVKCGKLIGGGHLPPFPTLSFVPLSIDDIRGRYLYLICRMQV